MSELIDSKNEAASCPEYLTAPDGRVFHLRAWTPRIAVDEAVSVVAELLVFSGPVSQKKPAKTVVDVTSLSSTAREYRLVDG